jgi:hypothetical protein
MNKWLLNGILAAAVIFFGTQIYQVWTRSSAPEEAAPAPSVSQKPPLQQSPARRQMPESHYEVIPGKNLFAVERGEGAAAEPVVNPKTAEASRYAKNVALYGTLIQEDDRSALVGAGRSRRTGGDASWVRIGDKLDQITVVGIERDRIYVREGTSTFEIRLDDRDHPLKRTTVQRSAAPTVITSKGAVVEKPQTPPPDVAPEQTPAPAKVEEAIPNTN